MIDLSTAPTPNGRKASVAFEELELPYEVHAVNWMAGDQKKPAYLQLNPNGRIPTIVQIGSRIESSAISWSGKRSPWSARSCSI